MTDVKPKKRDAATERAIASGLVRIQRLSQHRDTIDSALTDEVCRVRALGVGYREMERVSGIPRETLRRWVAKHDDRRNGDEQD